jgi:hypothetical protein
MARFITRSSIAVDTTGPTAPTITAAAASSSAITINRTVSATDSSGVSYYETQRSPAGAGTWTTFDSSNTNPVTATGLSTSTAYDFRQRGVDTLGNAGTYSSTVSATTDSGVTYEFTGLTTGLSGLANDGGTVWDSVNGYAVVTTTGSVQGLSYSLLNRSTQYLYVKVDCRKSSTTQSSKHFKVFGQNISGRSNCTWAPGGYAGDRYGIYYGDNQTGGNDATTEMKFDGVLTGGGFYSRTPHPTFVVTSTVLFDTSFHTEEYWMKFNDTGVANGELACILDGVVKFHAKNLFNCHDGGNLRDYFSLTAFTQSPGVGVIEYWKNLYVGTSLSNRPSVLT